ncbi:MAG: RagB/SusD family nutrient uptake outer membrane protein, partial [Flavobacterium sp.]|nr:RagB/SusD family nutrient uptake outer membrane protein [Flavobacterium sp.]
MKIKNIFLITLFAVLFVSCEDAINIDPKDEITDSNAIKSMAQLRLAATGVYGAIGGQSFIEWSAYFTDECRKGIGNRGAGVAVHTWSVNTATDEVEAYYSGIYSTINSANTVLAKMDNVSAVTEEDKKEKQKIYAELIAIRAIAHFDLLRFFATSYTDPNALAVPIVDKVIVFEQL